MAYGALAAEVVSSAARDRDSGAPSAAIQSDANVALTSPIQHRRPSLRREGTGSPDRTHHPRFTAYNPTLAREIARCAPQGNSRCGGSEHDYLLLCRRALPLIRERRSTLRSEYWAYDPSTPSICLTPGGRYRVSVLRGRVTDSGRARLRRSVRASADSSDQREMRCYEQGSGDQ